MIGRFIRVIFGFALASLAAGLTVVLFVYTPAEISDLPSDRLTEVGFMALAAATHSAVFAAPFAVIGAVFGEWQRIGSWMYYVLVAVAIAAVGFLAQFWTEATGEATIVNSYAVTAFLLTGFVAGTVYWLFAGRFAGRRGADSDILPPSRPAPSSSGPTARTAA